MIRLSKNDKNYSPSPKNNFLYALISSRVETTERDVQEKVPTSEICTRYAVKSEHYISQLNLQMYKLWILS